MYTEKTSGGQIHQMLTMLFGDKADDLKVKYDNSNIGFRVPELPSLGEIVEVLNTCNIDPMFIAVDTMLDHLTLWVCNYDGTEIE